MALVSQSVPSPLVFDHNFTVRPDSTKATSQMHKIHTHTHAHKHIGTYSRKQIYSAAFSDTSIHQPVSQSTNSLRVIVKSKVSSELVRKNYNILLEIVIGSVDSV